MGLSDVGLNSRGNAAGPYVREAAEVRGSYRLRRLREEEVQSMTIQAHYEFVSRSK